MTGVYDLSGGGWERVTSYIANENKNLSTYGKLIAYNGDILKTESTKYTMVYPHDSTLDNKDVTITEENLNKAREANYKKNLKIYGDAIRETSMLGTANTSWNGDYSGFASLSNPFVRSGGNFWNNSGAGRFCFDSYDGDSTYSGGIRPIVIPISQCPMHRKNGVKKCSNNNVVKQNTISSKWTEYNINEAQLNQLWLIFCCFKINFKLNM